MVGLRYLIVAKLENIQVNLSIDMATGDIITPREIEYEYEMLFEDRKIKIMTYTIETIIAEKLQTLVSRGIINGRMKDYYDLYYILTYKEFSKENLKIAIEKTFTKRETDVTDIDNKINEIEKSEFIKESWNNYSKKHRYANNVKLEDVIEKIRKMIKDILSL